MIRIEAEQWLSSVYARAIELTDVLRHPVDGDASMNADEKDKLRQSQIENNEVVRILGFHDGYALIMKSDQVIGWVNNDSFIVDTNIQAFEPPQSLELSAREFFEYWQNTPYVWAGITRNGIDCSGFTQRYFRDVLNRIIPKNSYDQRRAGKSKPFAEVTTHDLVFCTRIGGRGIHHVGIYVEGEVWHAHGELGVIRQILTEFLTNYQILEIINLRP